MLASLGEILFSASTIRWSGRNARMIAPLTTFVALFIFFSFATDVFFTLRNLQNVITQVAPIAVAATGITFVLLCAEIDLSIASISTFSGILVAYFWVGTWLDLGNWGIPVGILAAAGLGLLNGFFIAYIRIPSFMMTLAMLTIAKGLATYVSEGKPIGQVPTVLKDLASAANKFGGFPVIGIFALGVLIAGEIILGFTKFGRYVYMTGGNREAAEMSGIDTRKVIMFTMMISGLTAGMAGMLFVGRLSSANPSAGTNVLLDTISAVVLGGTSLFGGEGGIKNTIIGVMIFGILSNGLNLLPNLSIYFKEALQGIILVAALLLNVVALRLEKVQTRTE